MTLYIFKHVYCYFHLKSIFICVKYGRNLRSAIFVYSEFNSLPIQLRFSLCATNAVVPLPIKGSYTVPPSGHPAFMQGTINASGYVAKWASLYGLVVTVQTERLFRLPLSINILPSSFRIVPSCLFAPNWRGLGLANECGVWPGLPFTFL